MRRELLAGLTTLMTMAAIACGPIEPATAPEAATAALSGASTSSFALGAINNAVVKIVSGVDGTHCTGTLLSAQVVATSRQCIGAPSPNRPTLLATGQWLTYDATKPAMTVLVPSAAGFQSRTTRTYNLGGPSSDVMLLRLTPAVLPTVAVPRALSEPESFLEITHWFVVGYGANASARSSTYPYDSFNVSSPYLSQFLCEPRDMGPPCTPVFAAGDRGGPVFKNLLDGPLYGVDQATIPGVEVDFKVASNATSYRGWLLAAIDATRAPPRAASPRESSVLFPAVACEKMAEADVNRDGINDIVCLLAAGERGGIRPDPLIEWDGRTMGHISTGTGLAPWRQISPDYPAGFTPRHCKGALVGDIDGDGDVDLVCPYSDGTSIQTWKQTNSGVGPAWFSDWTVASPASSGSLAACVALALADADADGDPDLICVRDEGTTTRTYVQENIGGAFSSWVAASSTQTLAIERCRSIHVQDVTADGRADIVCTMDYEDNAAQTLVQRAMPPLKFATWSTTFNPRQPTFDVSHCMDIGLYDADRDGIADLVCPYLYTFEGEVTTYVQKGASTGQFATWAPWSTHRSRVIYSECAEVLFADVNGDGVRDPICFMEEEGVGWGDSIETTFASASFASGGFAHWNKLHTREIDGGLSCEGDCDFQNPCVSRHAIDLDRDGRAEIICERPVRITGSDRMRTEIF